MHASEVTPEAVQQANDLYWDSDRSVNQIADVLDLSKGALYGIIAPQASGLGCPLCGDEVVYPNRTAKEKDRLACPTCDWDGSTDETTTYSVAADSHEAEDDDLDYGYSPVPLPPPPIVTPRMSTIAGGALIGAAVGLALVLWARRR